MSHYECPMKQNHFCFHKEAFDRYHVLVVDDGEPCSQDLAYDAMVTHLDEVHGIRGPEAAQMVHNSVVVEVPAWSR